MNSVNLPTLAALSLALMGKGSGLQFEAPPFSLSDQQTYAGDRQLPGGRGQVSRLTDKRET